MRTNFILMVCLLGILLLNSCSQNQTQSEREILFNDDWKFIRADVTGAEKPNFDDSAWRTLVLPHDYSIEDLPEEEGVKQIGPFSEESAGKISTGHVVGGTAWYRKHFTLGKQDVGKIIQILFDGIYMNSEVWINGKYLGNHPYGYTAFAYNLTEYLNPDGVENVLAVQVKNEGENSRWYSGSGIYRNVKLIKTNPVHVDLWGNYITTPRVSKQMSIVNIETSVVNSSTQNEEIEIRVELKDPEGEIVATSGKSISIKSASEKQVQQELEVKNPQLWDTENPNLYSAIISVMKGNNLIDKTELKFGIRSIEFSPEKGFLLNGESVLIKGGCVHHDNGILGSATFERAEYRRVEIMKENGFNGIRCAHNPPSAAFLNACDDLGMLVMNESFDQWQISKKPQDYNLYFDEWWERDMESMLLRDRNHPSIIVWSFGNEIAERADSSGLEIARFLKDKIKEFDITRPVTQAICELWQSKDRTWEEHDEAFSILDVHGYNYQWRNYVSDHERCPERIIIGTESLPLEAFENWQMVEKYPYVIGDFVWTGMDYFGESGIGNTSLESEKQAFLPDWPWFNGYCGDISILGYKKPQMYFRDVVWKNSNLEIMVHTPVPKGDNEIVSRWGWPNELKSWNWNVEEGTILSVNVYSRCEEVRLELNGKVIATKPVSNETKLTANFEVPYQPGELLAIGIKNGKEVTREVLKTAGKPAQIKIVAEEETISASPNDLAYFNVEVLDKDGVLVPNAEIPINFNIQGNCKLQAVGNGNPTDMKSFQKPFVNTFRGRCQLIVRSCEDGGDIIVTAKSGELKSGECKIIVN